MHTFTQAVNTYFSASSTSAVALDVTGGRLRKYASFVNTGATDAYLGLGADAVSGSGIYLKSGGGSYEINANNLFLGKVYVIAASSTNIAITEGY